MSSGRRQGPSRSTMLVMVTSPILSVCMLSASVWSCRSGLVVGSAAGPSRASRYLDFDARVIDARERQWFYITSDLVLVRADCDFTPVWGHRGNVGLGACYAYPHECFC